MIQLDRTFVDDAGSDPIDRATAILDQLPNRTNETPVRELCAQLGIIELREVPLDSIEGAAFFQPEKYEGKILVNSNRSERRKRFTIAHELGHFVCPFHYNANGTGFQCAKKDLYVSKRSAKTEIEIFEAEANLFAAELLMPSNKVLSVLAENPDPDISVIAELSRFFNVSKEAAARRYFEKTDAPLAIVFSKHGIIRYILPKDSFPRLKVWKGDPIPLSSISDTHNDPSQPLSHWRKVSTRLWLNPAGYFDLFEQTLLQRDGFKISMLLVEN
jgi:Zn-dependent peptidase ImmA (M78 family)